MQVSVVDSDVEDVPIAESMVEFDGEGVLVGTAVEGLPLKLELVDAGDGISLDVLGGVDGIEELV